MIMSLKCAHRWRVRRRRVRIIVPDQGLSDMNDVLQQGGGWRVQSDYQSSDLRSIQHGRSPPQSPAPGFGEKY